MQPPSRQPPKACACRAGCLHSTPAQVLGGYEQAVRLAALLRLEGICEALVAGLAAAAGLSAPAPHSSAAEAKQVRQERGHGRVQGGYGAQGWLEVHAPSYQS